VPAPTETSSTLAVFRGSYVPPEVAGGRAVMGALSPTWVGHSPRRSGDSTFISERPGGLASRRTIEWIRAPSPQLSVGETSLHAPGTIDVRESCGPLVTSMTASAGLSAVDSVRGFLSSTRTVQEVAATNNAAPIRGLFFLRP